MTDRAIAPRLSMSEGVLLAHAMIARMAADLGVRAFFIKGPASVLLGIRDPKISTDADVFVAPSDLEMMVQCLRERGWRERPVDPERRTFPKHSVTVDHADWPCCIDIHFRFPGMEAPAGDSFELMWSLTEELDLAGQMVKVPSIPLGILFLALHALRSPHLPTCQQELEFLARFTEQQSHAPAILDIALATDSLAAMRPFLQGLLEESSVLEWPQPSLEWRNRLLSKEPGTARLLAIGQAPWKARPGMLCRAVFPSSEAFLSGNIYADMTVRGRLLLHGARWARFLQAAPRLVRDLRHGG